MIAGFRDDLQTKRVEKQELHTRLQKLQVGPAERLLVLW